MWVIMKRMLRTRKKSILLFSRVKHVGHYLCCDVVQLIDISLKPRIFFFPDKYNLKMFKHIADVKSVLSILILTSSEMKL